MKTMTREDWIAGGKKLYGDDMKRWKFRCPNCNHVQCGQDFIDLNIENSERYVYFTCIGRFIEGNKGEIGNDIAPCNYTNGGLFNFAKLQITDGNKEPVFVFEFSEAPC